MRRITAGRWFAGRQRRGPGGKEGEVMLTDKEIEAMSEREISARIAERVMGWRVVHYVGPEKVDGYVYPFSHYYEAPDSVVRNDVPNECSYWSPSTKIEHAFEMEAEIEKRQLWRDYTIALAKEVSKAMAGGDEIRWRWRLIRATPMQRCKAALRAARTEGK